MGKAHSKPLEERHGSGTAWTRHVMCESALRGCNPKVIYGLCKHTRPVILRPITELQGHGKGFPQSAWEFSLHQYLLRRLSTFVLNPNPASSRKNKNAPILYLSNAALLSGHYWRRNMFYKTFDNVFLGAYKCPLRNCHKQTLFAQQPTFLPLKICSMRDTRYQRTRFSCCMADKITTRGRFALLNPTRYFSTLWWVRGGKGAIEDKLCRSERVLRMCELSVLLLLTSFVSQIINK